MYSKSKLLQLFTCIDLTSLEASDNEITLKKLIEKANTVVENNHVAAVCVYPNFGDFARLNLTSGAKTAVVAGCFPSGQTLTDVKIKELDLLEKSSVDEVDIVINRGQFLAGNLDYVKNELHLMRAAIPSKKLKIILETGELRNNDDIRSASELAIFCGADFIKTSTGKSTTGATTEAVEIMCQVIKNHHSKTGKKIGIKPSGGIRTIDQALLYLDIVEKINGTEWIQPDLFRIGASTLYDAVITELTNGNHA